MSESSFPKTVNFALQGGGSHGAFTWGVMDRLLEDGRLKIEGVSGTSAGAINGALLVHGYAKGGPTVARETLNAFWERLGSMTPGMPHRTLIGRAIDSLKISTSPGTITGDILKRMFSLQRPHEHYVNPLRGLLEDILDIEAMRAYEPIKFFAAATSVEQGRIRIFSRDEITVDALLASGCLPYVFPAVEIAGKPYWDGAFVGNPALFPLIEQCESRDIIIIQITPFARPGTPRNPADIFSRMNEITFNAPFMSDLKAIALAKGLIESENLKNGIAARFRDLKVHIIAADDEMRSYGAASKFKSDIVFLRELKELGRRTAAIWLQKNISVIGIRSTVDFTIGVF